jgi:SAM-dependent methyltransferase
MEERTREPQYQNLVELRKTKGLTPLGLMTSGVWSEDPRRLGFVLARYKFVAKMLSGLNRVLEIGCADAFGTRIVQQEVDEVVAVDFDPVFVDDVRARMDSRWKFTCLVHDMTTAPLPDRFDGIYSIDVLEHVTREKENLFLKNIVLSLASNGVCIIGTPSLESQVYASAGSKEGHVNCKKGSDLKALLQGYFHNVFVFGMNDEVVHTGFLGLAHYLFALCTNKKAIS